MVSLRERGGRGEVMRGLLENLISSVSLSKTVYIVWFHFVKIHPAIHLRFLHFSVCKLCFNKNLILKK